MDTSKSRTPSVASANRAETLRMLVDGKSRFEISMQLQASGDEGATLRRVSDDLRTVKREDLVFGDDYGGLERIARYQNIISMAKDGFSRSADIEFLRLILDLEAKIEQI